MAEVAKSKMMTYQPGAIRLVMSEEAVGREIIGKGATHWERQWSCLPCLYCGV